MGIKETLLKKIGVNQPHSRFIVGIGMDITIHEIPEHRFVIGGKNKITIEGRASNTTYIGGPNEITTTRSARKSR